MAISQYFVEFIFYSFLGWIWESIYCTAKEHKWQDRGFLFGPVCPIYGSCVVAGSILFRYVPQISGPSFPMYAVFLLSMAVSAVAEYGTSWVLEKRFHARWWDYSKMPLNLHGRICLPVSLAFGAAGVVIVKYLIPLMAQTHQVFPGEVYEGLALAFALVLGGDFALTEASLSELLSEVVSFHNEFNTRAENTVEKIQETPHAVAAGIENTVEKIQETPHAVAAGIENTVEKIQETPHAVAAGIENTVEKIQEAPHNVAEGIETRVNQLQERSARIQASAGRRFRGLSTGARHVLRNMTVFHGGEELVTEGKSAGEHLKEAQLRLEDRIRQRREK